MRLTLRRCAASPLLQNIHCSLPTLQQLYASTAPPLPPAGTATQSNAPQAAPALFPRDPATSHDGDAVLRFFCEELGMGSPALRQWRRRLALRSAQRWGLAEASSSTGTPAAAPPPPPLPSSFRVPWTRVRRGAAADATSPSPSSPSLWLRPRAQDVTVVQSAMRHLRLLVSPLLLLSPPPLESTAAPTALPATPPSSAPSPSTPVHPHNAARPATHAECSRWYATSAIPAGMFLLSIPTEAVLFADPPPASDPLLHFFMQVEELVGQLVSAAADPAAPHHGYVSYLCDSVVPSRNLPFLSPADVRALLRSAVPRKGGTVPDGESATPPDGADLTSPALSLASFFHEDIAGEPLSDWLRQRLSRSEYAWWVSLVLAHRAGRTSLLPIIDKLNHSPCPNCYYTMATEDTMCGLDVLDNLIAGVPDELLYQPYVHVFALRDIAAGAELTLCYASAADGAYRPAAGGSPPPPPPSPPSRPAAGGGAGGAAPSHDSAGVMEAVRTLFPDGDGAAAALELAEAGGGELNRAVLRGLQHRGPQEVDGPEGRASWQLQWGFVPPCDAVFSAHDLRQTAALIAERRVDTRAELFPRAP